MSRLLDRITCPRDLASFTPPELQQLAAEIREELVQVVTRNGGHLASNLGAVELSIALHRMFDSPNDKIVWDVGHQAYVHKILTGRRERFPTIRQHGGLSGFTERNESEHDVFGAGHASTSISAALGMAVARDLAGESHHVVAVIGDGALTGGMALEALNQAGHLATRLIVVLNDNAMSISPNVGAISSALNKLRLDVRYHKAKKGLGHVITSLPTGKDAWRLAERMVHSFKGFLLPTLIWEELGFTYMGPVDGHNIVELQQAFHQAKQYRMKPTFIHVLTTKGKGYEPAEDDAVGFHGLAPNNGQKSKLPTYSKVFAQTCIEIAKQDPKVVAITAAMLEGTGLKDMAVEMPNRVFDVGICEQHAVTFAAGMATQGYTPIVAIYSTFLQRAYDQIVHDVCLQNLPVVFALDRSGIVGDDGKTHQGILDLSYLGSMPNMVVAAPKDENELRHLLYTAVRANRPVAVRFPRGYGLGAAQDLALHEIPIGHGEVLRFGQDVALIAIGATVQPSLEAAEQLSGMGVDCAVVNARFAKPLDAGLILDVARQTGRVVALEENVPSGGFGGAVVSLLEERLGSAVQVMRIGLPDNFIEHGPQEVLRAKYGLDTQGIVQQVLGFFPELKPLSESIVIVEG